MSVVFRLSALLKLHRSSSVYRSFSALAALIKFSHSYTSNFDCSSVYCSFAADGCIFQLESLARSLGDTCVEKEYLLALVDFGRAAFIAAAWHTQRYDDSVMRAELLDAITLQQYVPFPPTQSYLILFHQSEQRRRACFHWQSVHRPCKRICFPLVVASLIFPLHR